MYHDPEVKVSCDGDNCLNSVQLSFDPSHDDSDHDDYILTTDHAWETIGNKHYCGYCRGDV